MIYMVEMALLETARRAEWDAWYVAHQHRLLSIPGFRASQRFETIHTVESPFVALHEVDSPETLRQPPLSCERGTEQHGRVAGEDGPLAPQPVRRGPHPGCAHGRTSGGRRGG